MSKGIDSSKILLACFGLNVNRQNLKELTMQEIIPIFTPYKSLLRILIFTRKDLVKAFIQFDSMEDSIQAKIQLDGNYYGKYGKMKLYYSEKKKLDCSNKFFELWEPERENLNTDQQSNQSKGFQCQSQESKEQDKEKRSFRGRRKLSSWEAQKMCSSRQTAKERINLNDNTSNNKGSKNYFSNQKQILEQNKEKCPSMFQNPFTKQISQSSHPKKKYQTYFDLTSEGLTKKQPTSEPSRVILLSNIGFIFKQAKEIHHLFSNFGNIRMIIFMKSLQKALIEYYSIDSAKKSIKNLNGITLGPSTLNIQHSLYKQLIIEDQKENRDFIYFNEIMMIDKKMHRFNLRNYKKICPASRYLTVTATSSYEFFADELMCLIHDFCNPLKNVVNIEVDERKKVVFQVSLEFEDKASAVYFMYKCHDRRVKDSNLIVSFSNRGKFDNH